jgi:hypothetical protein
MNERKTRLEVWIEIRIEIRIDYEVAAEREPPLRYESAPAVAHRGGDGSCGTEQVDLS